MERAELPIRSTIFSMGAFGAVIGFMVGKGRSPANSNEIWFYVAAGVLVFAWFGWGIVNWMSDNGQDVEYAAEVQTVETCVLVIKIPELGSKLIHGLSREEWTILGKGVVEYGYKFSVPSLQEIFKDTEYNGRTVYEKTVRRLKDAAALVPNQKGGVDVTDHVGRTLFDALANGAYETLDQLPHYGDGNTV